MPADPHCRPSRTPPRPPVAIPRLLLLLAASLAVAALPAGALPIARAASPGPMAAMEEALTSARAQLSATPVPAYYMAIALTEEATLTIQGSAGALAAAERGVERAGDVDLRVGSMQLDNTHKILDAGWFSSDPRGSLSVPLGSDFVVLRNYYLRALDDAYRGAREQLIKVRANQSVKVEREDRSDDFSPAPVVIDERPVGTLSIDEAQWQALVKQASAIFLQYPDIYDSAVQIVTSERRSWLATSDGTRIQDGHHHLRVAAWGTTVAEDGMQLQVYDYVDVASVAHLPDREAVLALTRGVARRLVDLRAAPLVDPYAGPAILRGRAAGVFFHEIFGHRVEGHRQKDEDEGQTFTSRVGKSILPDFLSVIDDPTQASVNGVDLNGYYHYDDEGVVASRVQLVKDGVLLNFLMSRAPVAGFPASNGHGRRQPGRAPVARQGNLMVQASRTVPYAQLRTMLVAEVKRAGKPFGLVFDDISGGFTFTGRSQPNAFVVNPVSVWKVFPDGRPDQLVRGVDMIGTPLTTFASITAAADDLDVFNGVCGAESGWVPVSASSPSLLVQEVEVQRHEKANDRPPLLPPPGILPTPEPS